MGTNYFTKGVEDVPTRHITHDDLWKFIYNNITTRFGTQHILVMNNCQQFKGHEIKEKYKSFRIRHALSTPGYEKSNGKAETSNKMVLNNLKKILNATVTIGQTN